MTALHGNAVVGQSGGPTAAINATLAGVILGAKKLHEGGVIDTLYGMRNGIEGFLQENLVDLSYFFSDNDAWDNLKTTPAAALGSCRKKLKSYEADKETYEKLLDIFKKHNIRYFFYIGGNDSMDTVYKLSEYAKSHDYEMCVVGVPKTVDNDLTATDHTPGFGSAAKFVATTVKEILRDVSVYQLKAVTVVEIMGRDAGWLTASAALPVISGGIAPDLVYLPEVSFDKDKFLASVRAALERHPAVLVAASEGIRFENGEYVAASGGALDAFGHAQLSGVGKVLESLVKTEIGCKVRSIELNLPQRCAGHILSATDIDESVRIGAAATEAAARGESGVMVIFVREGGDNYSVRIETADISKIANEVRRVPAEYINETGDGITDKGIAYLAPLIQGEVAVVYENGMPKHTII